MTAWMDQTSLVIAHVSVLSSIFYKMHLLAQTMIDDS